MTRSRGAVVVLGAVLALGACSAQAPQGAGDTQPAQIEEPPVGPPDRWACADGRVLRAVFYSDPERVSLTYPDGSVRTLPQVVSASGASFEADGLRFHTKGAEAVFAEGEQTTTCRLETQE